MVSASTSTPNNERVSFSRLLWVGPLTILAAIIANVVIQQIAVALLQPDPQFIPLTTGAVVFFTAMFVLVAVIVFALIGRFSRQPIALYRRVALIALIVSLIPDILMAITGFNPGTTVPNVIALMVMHVVSWAITVRMLTTLARE